MEVLLAQSSLSIFSECSLVIHSSITCLPCTLLRLPWPLNSGAHCPPSDLYWLHSVPFKSHYSSLIREMFLSIHCLSSVTTRPAVSQKIDSPTHPPGYPSINFKYLCSGISCSLFPSMGVEFSSSVAFYERALPKSSSFSEAILHILNQVLCCIWSKQVLWLDTQFMGGAYVPYCMCCPDATILYPWRVSADAPSLSKGQVHPLR